MQYPGQDPWILWLPSHSGWWGDGGWLGAGFCCLLCVEITTYNGDMTAWGHNSQFWHQTIKMHCGRLRLIDFGIKASLCVDLAPHSFEFHGSHLF